MTVDTPDQLGDVNDVADVLDCSPSSVWRHVANKKLPKPIKIGGMSRWPMSEIAAAIEAAKAEREAA